MQDPLHSTEISPLRDGDILRLIFQSATDFAIFTMDPNGITTSWNIGAQRLLGYAEHEIVGRTADVTFPPEDGGAEAAAEERRVALAEGKAEDERWQLHKDGTRFWASGLLMPLANPGHGFVKILRDRTAQHRVEEQLRHSEEQFRALATNIPQLVFRCRGDGNRTWGSPQWVVYTGLSFDSSVAFGWLDAIHPDDRQSTLEAWHRAMARGEYYVEHRVLRSTSKEYRWHQTRAVPLDPDNRATEWVGTTTDIHDLRTLQDRQMVLLAELQHRTRNLLGVVQALAHRSARSAESLRDFMPVYESRLRALSRVQALLTRTGHNPIELRDLIEGEFRAHGDGRSDIPDGVTIAGPPAFLAADAAQTLALALHELATNATKYGALASARGMLAVTWCIEGEGNERRIRLEWQESGVPILEGTPRQSGYGSELIQRALPYQLSAQTSLEFGKDGVRCEIILPMATGAPA